MYVTETLLGPSDCGMTLMLQMATGQSSGDEEDVTSTALFHIHATAIALKCLKTYSKVKALAK